MTKKITSIILTFFIFSNSVFGACKLESEISQCNSELKDFIGVKDGKSYFVSPGASIKSIEDFTCLQNEKEKRLYQISLDKNFEETDLEMEDFLHSLEDAKSTFYGEGAKNYLDGINVIWEKSDYFTNKYENICATDVVNDALECSDSAAYLNGAIANEKGLSTGDLRNYLLGNKGDCSNLVEFKVAIFRTVAFNTLLINKGKVLENNKKEYDIGQRSNYNNLLDLMMVNFGYIERLWHKWPSKTKDAH